MVKHENQCCDCETSLYPCMEKNCDRRDVKIYVCDCCHDEVDELFEYDNEEQLCTDCLLKKFKKVKEEI